MRDVFILGWSYEQWVKAFEYRNLREKEQVRNCFHDALAENSRERPYHLKHLAETKQYWQRLRSDEPASTILPAVGYRVRAKGSNNA